MNYEDMPREQLIDRLRDLGRRVAVLEERGARVAKVQTAIERAKREWERTFDAVPDLIAILDKDHRIVRINRAMACAGGMSPKEAIGRRCFELMHGTSAPPEHCPYVRMVNDGMARVTESYRNRLGLTLEESVSPLRDEDGNLTGCVYVARDITERKAAEQALQKSEAKYRDLFENANDIIYTHDLHGNLTSVNGAVKRILGYAPEEFRKLNLRDLVVPGSMSVFEEILSGGLKNPAGSGHHELAAHSRDGNPVWLELSTRILKEAGKPRGVEGVARDISERKSAERELRHRDRLLQSVAISTQSLFTATDFETAIYRTLETLGQAVGVNRVYIFEYHSDSRTGENLLSRRYEWISETATLRPSNPQWEHLSCDGRFSRWYGILKRGRPIMGLVGDLPGDEREVLEAQNILSILVVPIILETGFWGFIGFDDTGTDRVWAAGEASILHAAAGSVGGAIEKFRAVEALQRAHDDLEKRVAQRTGELLKTNERLQREIIDHKLVREELRKREARFRGYFELPLIGMATVSRERRWVEVNDRLCGILGVSRNDLTGMTLADLTHPDDLPTEEEYFYQMESGEMEGYSTEKRFIRKGGEIIHAFMSTRCLRRPDGSVDHFVGLIQDITQRKIDQERRDQLVEEIKNFAYIVSHDLRAPLTNLKGFSQELETAADSIRPAVELAIPQLPSKTRLEVTSAFDQDLPEAVEFISSAVSSMDRLINGILKLSRLEHSQLHFEQLNMKELVRRVLKTFAYQTSKEGIKLSMGNLPSIAGDTTAVEQIVGNLVSNATKYLDPARPGFVEITGERTAEETLFHVRDNGVGIEKKDRYRIFDIFQRVEGSAVSGEGVGLAYVRTLARRHGGRIWCESEPGVGSTFTFTIPNNLIQGLTILAIDDVESVADTIKRGLTKQAHSVLTALSGEEGIEVFKENHVDLVICDIGMGAVGGWEVGRTIKELCETQGISRPPFIILTGWVGQSALKRKMAESGVDRVLEKPINMHELLEVIRSVVRSPAQE
ncbi:PAS domain S-box protein [Thermodesulfobacteriota bacterium]